MNETRNRSDGDTPLTQPRSLDVHACIVCLTRLRPTLAPEAQPIVSTLIGQLKAWESGDREELRRTIGVSVERLKLNHRTAEFLERV